MVIKSVQNGNFTQFYLFNTHGINDLFGLEISKKMDEAYIFTLGIYNSYLYVFNFKSNSIYYTSLSNYDNNRAYIINDQIYDTYITFNGNSIQVFPNLNSSQLFTFNTNTQIEDYSISPDLSKLVTIDSVLLNNYSFELITKFYQINFNVTGNVNLVSDITQVFPLNPISYSSCSYDFIFNACGYTEFQFIWNNNNSSVYYSIPQGDSTVIYSFNYKELKENKIAQIPSKANLINVDLEKSLIFLNNVSGNSALGIFQIYSYSSSNVTLKQQNQYTITNWNNTKMEGITFDFTKVRFGSGALIFEPIVYLLSYEDSTNSLTQKLLLDPSTFLFEDQLFNNL